jgi:HNH endonuclease
MMQNVLTVFGPHSGRLYSVPPGSRNGGLDSRFSIAALEIQASALLGREPIRVQKVADQIREHFLLLLLTNEEIRIGLMKATTNRLPTKLRWTLFRSIIQPLLDDLVIEPRFFSYEHRKQLFDSNPLCEICKNQILSFEDSTVDHVIPYSRNGKTVPENAQLAHRLCNASKNATMSNVPPKVE